MTPAQRVELFYRSQRDMAPDDLRNLHAAYQMSWVEGHGRTAESLFDELWSSHSIVGLGELHHRPKPREFVARMLAKHGGPGVALALEIPSDQQWRIDGYLLSGVAEGGWWADYPEMHALMRAAYATGTRIVAIDAPESAREPGLSAEDNALKNRDPHMARQVSALKASADKVLIFIGGLHLRRGEAAKWLGQRLGVSFGASFASMDLYDEVRARIDPSLLPPADSWRPTVAEFLTLVDIGFDFDPSIGMKLAGSPLELAPDPASPSTAFGANLDAIALFRG